MTGPVGIESFVGPPRQAPTPSSGAPFISDWNTANTSTGSSTSTQVSLPLEAAGTYDFVVHWGDGTSDTITAWDDSAKTHTYALSGTYRISITGKLRGWTFNAVGDRLKLLDVINWGILDFGNSGAYFSGCANMVVTAVDAPILTNTTMLQDCFYNCTALTMDPSRWDVSTILNMYRTFANCVNLNGDVSAWDVSSGTSFNTTFLGASLFNQPLHAWDVSGCANFSFMFFAAT